MVLGSRHRDSVQPGDVDDPVQDELHRDRGEQKAHDSADGSSAGTPESPEDSVRVVKQDERDEDGHEDPREDEQLVRGIVDRMGHVDHDGRDRPGACEERDAEGHDGDLIPLERLLSLLCRQPRAGALASEHLERDAKEDDPPAILKAGIVNPNAAKIHWPKTAKTPRVIVVVRHAFEMMFCFCAGVRSSVRTEKNGTTPRGSTIAKMEAMAVAPNAKSTMVVPDTDGA